MKKETNKAFWFLKMIRFTPRFILIIEVGTNVVLDSKWHFEHAALVLMRGNRGWEGFWITPLFPRCNIIHEFMAIHWIDWIRRRRHVGDQERDRQYIGRRRRRSLVRAELSSSIHPSSSWNKGITWSNLLHVIPSFQVKQMKSPHFRWDKRRALISDETNEEQNEEPILISQSSSFALHLGVKRRVKQTKHFKKSDTEVCFINRGRLNFGGQFGFWQWIFDLRNAQAQLNFKLNFGGQFCFSGGFWVPRLNFH